VVSNFIAQALRGENLTIYGDGSQTRAFCYVDDLINGFIAMMAADDDITGPINLGNPHEIPVRILAEQIVAITGSRSGIVHRPLPQDDPLQRCPDITRAKRMLGWSPKVSLEDGLRRTIAYFQSELGERDAAQGERARRIYEAALAAPESPIIAPPATGSGTRQGLSNGSVNARRNGRRQRNENGAGEIGA